MNIQNDKMEQKCYLDYLIAKYITPRDKNANLSAMQYNITQSTFTNQPSVIISKE